MISPVKLDCRIEISYIDPETYTSLVNHDLRKQILKTLYGLTFYGPISKQQLADNIGLGYHQLVYQLNNHLADFWCVAEEQKVRGTRKELIKPANRHAVYITLGREKGIHMVDPIANLFGPLCEVGIRCDSCSRDEADNCLRFLAENPQFDFEVEEADSALLEANGIRPPFRPLDLAILAALRGIASDQRFLLSIPCASCAFLRRTIQIEGIE
ncbi:MAG TPA: hypothetical protein VMW26_09830 [Methanomassiliicoccales archaeon]|nr:hypothetical protein [Methanomassiliicoccales archaeon]